MKIYLLLILLLLPTVSAWEFTEVMANPNGPDKGYEWVELLGKALPATAKFVEDGGTHSITLVQGSCQENCTLLIADKANNYLHIQEENLLLYDTSFTSLRNSGETLLLTINNTKVASITYENAPSGLSLQEGTWQEPTPGTHKKIVAVPEFSVAISLLLLLTLFIIRRKN